MRESTTIIKFECDGEKKSDAVGRARVEGRERTSDAPGQAVAWGGLKGWEGGSRLTQGGCPTLI